MKKSVCLSQDSNLGSLIYLYGLIQPIRGRNRVNRDRRVDVPSGEAREGSGTGQDWI